MYQLVVAILLCANVAIAQCGPGGCNVGGGFSYVPSYTPTYSPPVYSMPSYQYSPPIYEVPVYETRVFEAPKKVVRDTTIRARAAHRSKENNNRPSSQILYFTGGDWCVECIKFEENEAPTLREKGWGVVDKVDAKIRKMNYDKYKEFADKLGVVIVPTFIVYKDDKEIARHEGYMTAKEVADLWYRYFD